MVKWKTGVWMVVTVVIFILFWWLFSLAIPEIALPFAIGITVILVSGLIIGRLLYKLWSRSFEHLQTRAFFALILSFMLCFAGIGLLVNRMIVKTEFFDFTLTILLLFLLSACIGAAVTLVRNRIQRADTALAHSRSELRLLQAQLSPHFLFNTLNNLYGLSLTDQAKVPPLLLKLSDLLRYTVYDAKDLLVPLQLELDYINNYIAFERLRLGDRLELHKTIDVGANTGWTIPPMLLVVFIENAFKHARNTRHDRITVNIVLQDIDGDLVFSIGNSCSDAPVEVNQKHSGFGLESVRKRLSLLYPGRHRLTISTRDNMYNVQLILKK